MQVLAAAALPDEPWRLGGHLLPARPAGGSGAAVICSDKGRFSGGYDVACVHTRTDFDDGLVMKRLASTFSNTLSCGEQWRGQKLFLRVRSQLSSRGNK